MNRHWIPAAALVGVGVVIGLVLATRGVGPPASADNGGGGNASGGQPTAVPLLGEMWVELEEQGPVRHSQFGHSFAAARTADSNGQTRHFVMVDGAPLPEPDARRLLKALQDAARAQLADRPAGVVHQRLSFRSIGSAPFHSLIDAWPSDPYMAGNIGAWKSQAGDLEKALQDLDALKKIPPGVRFK